MLWRPSVCEHSSIAPQLKRISLGGSASRMPSLQQLRNEALADAAERARRPSPVLEWFGAPAGPQPIDVRVECHDGTSIDFRLLELTLDGGEVLGRELSGASVVLPLDRVKTLWHHRRRTGRALSLWFGTVLTSAAAGGVLAAATGWARVAEGTLGGALLGTLTGIGVVLLLDKWNALYEWVRLFDRAAAA